MEKTGLKTMSFLQLPLSNGSIIPSAYLKEFKQRVYEVWFFQKNYGLI